MNLPPRHPSATINNLAKQRNRAAAERTLTVWIQNCLTLIGFGIAFDRIVSALLQAFPQADWRVTYHFATILGLSFIGLGIGLLLIAIWQYCLSLRFLDHADYITQPSQLWLTVVTTAIVVFGVLSAIAVLVKAV